MKVCTCVVLEGGLLDNMLVCCNKETMKAMVVHQYGDIAEIFYKNQMEDAGLTKEEWNRMDSQFANGGYEFYFGENEVITVTDVVRKLA